MRSRNTMLNAMHRTVSAIAIGICLAAAGCSSYPRARQVTQVDDYHGTRVADPYRWLEDPDSPQTQAWIEAENRITFAQLASIPQRPALRTRLTVLWDYERFDVPWKRGGRYFMFRNDGLQNQDVLYVMGDLESTPQVLIDPNTFSTDGTVALTGVVVSEDGRFAAYGISSGGSDWQEWKVRDIEGLRDLDDQLKWIKFSSVAWTHDGRGFFYSRYDEPQEGQQLQAQNYYQKLYYHRLGTAQAQDELIYQRPDQKEWSFAGEVTEDGRLLIISVWKGTQPENLVFYKDLAAGGPITELVGEFKAMYGFIGNDGLRMWFHTDDQAPRRRVVAIDAADPAKPTEIIAEHSDTLESVSLVGGRLIGSYLQDARSAVRVFNLDGSPVRDVDLPGIGRASGFGGRRDDSETFYSFTSFSTPTAIFRYDVATGRSTLLRRPEVRFSPDDYVTEQVFYDSLDGTRIPMFITFRKDLARGVPHPTLLYGYGGFNIAMMPRFSVANLVWMEMGGIYAVANLRGGGEYGKAWHDAGRLQNKQNVFDDFIAAAQWLIDQGYTTRRQLAITGRSNGGLLVGACMTQQPDLFAAAIPGVGVLDMLRFHKFTIGWAWTSDYGSPDDPEDFRTLYAYSPLHNIRPGTHYPATLIVTGDHDDRVVPAHSFKFAAALQAAQSGPAPILIRIETRAGHGAGKPTTMQIDESTDILAFLVRQLKMAPHFQS
jgi:prolyl oligopeptidase